MIINPQVIGPNSTSGNYYDYLLNDGGSAKIRGGYSNNVGSHASASYRPFRSSQPGTYWDVDGYEIVTETGKFDALINSVDASGGKEVRGWLRNIKTNVIPSSLTIIGSQLTNDLWVEINGGKEVAYNSNQLDNTYSTTNQDITALSLNRRGGETVFINATVTATGVQVSGINPGLFAGQFLVIRNSAGSSQNLQISSSSDIPLGGSVTLTPGGSIRLYWSGTAWLRA
jgi:hypothetical protein